ncbi:glyoxalase [filamentous cyanobacterium CCP1]|nr:glyoxalase [filamentous cyanobacterium CCP2]PSB59923.1 glyoxalase [filamentous cyanobacterium CCP1]
MQYDSVFVALADGDGEKLVRFYQDLFGQEPIVYVPNRYAEFQLMGLRLGIFQPSVEHQAEFAPVSGGSMSLCIEVKQLEAAIERLTELGCPPPGSVVRASHGKEIYAYDPAGNRLILHEAIRLP